MKHSRINRRAGFTLTEVSVAATISGLVVAAVLPLVVMSHRSWARARLQMDTHKAASLAVERMVFGMPQETGLRGCSSAAIVQNGADWTVEFTNIDGDRMTFTYDAAASNIVFRPGEKIVAENVTSSTLVRDNRTLHISVAVQGMYRGRAGSSTSTTSVAFRNQW